MFRMLLTKTRHSSVYEIISSVFITHQTTMQPPSTALSAPFANAPLRHLGATRASY